MDRYKPAVGRKLQRIYENFQKDLEAEVENGKARAAAARDIGSSMLDAMDACLSSEHLLRTAWCD
eukprot:7637247-Alexandrium_andersonii.AAC.1